VKVTNTVFADMGFLGTSNLGAGKAIDFRGGRVDTCILENNTFVNWQDRILRHYWSNAPLKYLKVNHNTFVNGMSYFGFLSLGRIDSSGVNPIIFTNNLMIDHFSLGNDTDATRSMQMDDPDETDPYGYNKMYWIQAVKSTCLGATFDLRNNYYTVSDTGQYFFNIYPFYHNEGTPIPPVIESRIAPTPISEAFRKVAIQPIEVPKLMTEMNRMYYTGCPECPLCLKTLSTVCFEWIPPNTYPYDYHRKSIYYYYDTLNCDFGSNVPLSTAGTDGQVIGDTRWNYLGLPDGSMQNENGNMVTYIPVHAGWNLISIPREQLDCTP